MSIPTLSAGIKGVNLLRFFVGFVGILYLVTADSMLAKSMWYHVYFGGTPKACEPCNQVKSHKQKFQQATLPMHG